MQTAELCSSRMFIRALSIDQFFFKPRIWEHRCFPRLTQHRQTIRVSRIPHFIFLSDKGKPNFSEDCGLKTWKSMQFTTYQYKMLSSSVIYYLTLVIIIIIIIFLHGLRRLTRSGIDALPSFRGGSTISSSTKFIVEGVFQKSGVANCFKMVDPVLFLFGSQVLYSREL